MVLRSNQVSCVPDETEDSGIAGPKVRVCYVCGLVEGFQQPLSTKMATLADHGHQEELTLGTFGHPNPKTIINVIIIT
jgi:hypothetical protein